MTAIKGHESEKLRQLREENTLINNELNSFKQLFCLFNERHLESVKYINILKDLNTKLFKRLNETENTINKLEEINCENNLLKLDKEIHSIQDILFSTYTKSHGTQTSPQIHTKHSTDRAIIKWNNKTNANNTNGRYRCEYFGCNQLFARKEQMESHLRIHNSMQEAISFEHNQSCSPFDPNFDKIKDNSNSSNKISEIIFVPQMELEVIEYSNAENTAIESLSYTNTSDDSNSNNRSDKSLVGCDICGKQFSYIKATLS